jgi:predicted TIM-barrel fold metal-dependent hydrolase
MKMTIDTHAHIFHRGLPLVSNRRYTLEYDATLADYLEQLDSHGLTHGVLVQPSFLGTDNSFLVEALRAHPDRLRGVAVVAPNVSPQELSQLAGAGVVGIRLNLVGLPVPDLQKPDWAALMLRVQTLGMHVEIHREAGDLEQLLAPLLESTGVNIVVDHFGRPDAEFGVDDPGFRYLLSTASSRRVWVKISGSYRNGAGGRGEATALAAMPAMREAFGLDRLVWGSDWPHGQFETTQSYDVAFAALGAWLPQQADRDIVLGRTAAELFRF